MFKFQNIEIGLLGKLSWHIILQNVHKVKMVLPQIHLKQSLKPIDDEI